MPGANAASPPALSLWHLRHFPAVYCSTNTPVMLHFMDFNPAEDIRERRRAVSCKDFALSSLHVSSLLLSTAAQHFPAEHEAMRLMSPICDSLSHPLPGGQCCLCLHGLKVLGEGWRLGFQVLYPAPLLSACRAEDPSKRPALGVMPMERAGVLGLMGMPLLEIEGTGMDRVLFSLLPLQVVGQDLFWDRLTHAFWLSHPCLEKSGQLRTAFVSPSSGASLSSSRTGENPAFPGKKANSGNDLSFLQVEFCVVGRWVFPPVVNEPLFSTGCGAIGILTMVVASWQPKS